MKSDEIAHLFAAENYSAMRKCSNVFADADRRTLYSYGTHFPVATHTGNPALPLLITSRGYSVTTAKHIREAEQALRHIRPMMHVHNPAARYPSDHVTNLEHIFTEARCHLEKASAPRIRPETRAAALASASRRAAEGEQYRTAFKVPLKLLSDKTRAERAAGLAIDPADTAAALDVIAKHKASVTRKQTAAQRKAEKKAREARAAWVAGTGSHYPHEGHDAPARLRVMDNAVETSQGARVHVRDAAKLWPLVQRAHRTGNTFTPENEFKVGYYTLNQIRPDGVTIGCHVIPYAEMERISAEVLAAAAR